jgi:hypothetical protein
MLRNARVYISDVMDQVVIEATMWEHDGMSSAVPESITCKAQMAGVGEEVPYEWLKEALICLIETL